MQIAAETRDGEMEGGKDTGWGNKLEQLCFMFDIVIGFALGLADVQSIANRNLHSYWKMFSELNCISQCNVLIRNNTNWDQLWIKMTNGEFKIQSVMLFFFRLDVY